MFQYSPILGRSSIWDLKFTFSQRTFSIIGNNGSSSISKRNHLQTDHYFVTTIQIVIFLIIFKYCKMTQKNRISSEDSSYSEYLFCYTPGGVLSGKVGTGMCGPDRVLFWPLRFSNGPFFI